MNKLRNIIFAGLIPLIALTTTSCGDKTKQLTFAEAVDYAREHYDANVLDAVTGSINANIKKLGINLDVDHIKPDGTVVPYNISFGFDNISVVTPGTYIPCVASEVINIVNAMYATFSSLSLEVFTQVPLEMKYFVENEALKLDVSMAGLGTKMTDILQVALSFVNLLATLPPSVLKYLGVLADYVEMVTQYFKRYKVGIDPLSKSVNDSFNLTAATDRDGFLSSGSFTFGTDLSMTAYITNRQKSVTSVNILNIVGRIDVDLDFSVNFSD